MIPHEIEAAALIGWHVYPVSNRSRAACFKRAIDAATCDLNVIAGWCREYPGCNWAVLCGPSRIWGIDADVPPGHAHDGVRGLTELAKVHGGIPPRPQLRSGGGGMAIFFAHADERIIGDAGHPAPGCDPRRGRQSQTIPPSRHIKTGQPYRWIDPPWRIAPPTAPGWLLRLVEPPPEVQYTRSIIDTTDAARNRLYRAATAVAMAGPGERNGTLNRRAYQVGRMIAGGLLAEQEAVEALYGAARSAGLDHLEIKATLKSGISSGMRRSADGR